MIKTSETNNINADAKWLPGGFKNILSGMDVQPLGSIIVWIGDAK